jgi:hypothetical protein
MDDSIEVCTRPFYQQLYFHERVYVVMDMEMRSCTGRWIWEWQVQVQVQLFYPWRHSTPVVAGCRSDYADHAEVIYYTVLIVYALYRGYSK